MRGPSNPQLNEALGACRGGFLAVVAFSLGINVLMLTAPLFMLQVFDRVLSSRSTDTLVMLMLVAGFALMALAALDAIRATVLIRLSTWLDARISGSVLAGSVLATLRNATDPSVQALRDLATFRTFLSGPGIFPVMDAPWTPIFLGVIFMLHPLLGWLSLAGASVLFALALTNELATRNLLAASSVASFKALNRAEAAVRNADVIEAMGMMPQLVRRWHRQNAESLDLQARASSRSTSITSASKFLRLVLQIGILGVGAWLVIESELTPGAMIAAFILMGRALAPVEQAIGSWKQMVAARGAYQRMKRQLDETPVRGLGMPLPAPSGHVSVEGLSFVFPGASEPILRNVNFELHAGEALGLIGPTAVGKTTLARLMIGNLAPRTGHVRLDGMDVAEWDSDDMGRHVGYLPQDIELFSGTVRENIARMADGEPDAVIAAARIAGMHEMVLGMAQGYDTEIGEGGTALSGGQRQRIGLACAVYGDPRFVVLDEPNANLDGAGEAALSDAIDTLKERGATIVVIAHRPSVLRQVDKVVVLRDGTVDKFGPREQVIPGVSGEYPERGIRDAPTKAEDAESATAPGLSQTTVRAT